MKILSTAFKITLFIFICIALYKEIYVDGAIVLGAFYYFTIQSNILVAFYLMLFAFVPVKSRVRCLLRGIALLAITLTGIVYNFVLYNIFLDWGTAGYTFARTITHVVAPLGFIADWILFDKRIAMKLKDIFLWLIYPIVYGLIFAYVSYRYDFYIYFFFSTTNGRIALIMQLSLLLCFAVIIGLFYFGLDKLIGHLQNKSCKCRI